MSVLRNSPSTGKSSNSSSSSNVGPFLFWPSWAPLGVLLASSVTAFVVDESSAAEAPGIMVAVCACDGG